ncbi:hypothetical protein BD324DRAFT_15568 [Kockovaella imperatae]|uniref:RING-type domain-containing protein n=1 Tax=Kockovaella imperatae TaxID=4999 RepID=A0A1Y1URJ5_9TREE|nr:hypothetical protein BD324DRAFT_15568 [Kockovaella imperatae]ORX40683.1 hypothetical protein BD324DRAFT_15568 [Kockovaella imperatae]
MSSALQAAEAGYDYVEDIDPNLTCAICQSALVDPVTTASCKHTFCRDCIHRAISVNPQCPIDRSALTTQSLRDTEQLVKLMLDELKVRCGSEGCGQIMQRGHLLGHVTTCQKAMIKCHEGECGLSMARFRLPHHRAYDCFQRRMECDKCGVILTFKDRTSHSHPGTGEDKDVCEACDQTFGTNKSLHQWHCPQARVPCPHQKRGCAALPARAELSTHLIACPFEPLAAYFDMCDARMSRLEQRNEELVLQMTGLQSELDNLRLMIPRQTIGDRWTAAGLGGLSGVRNMRAPTSPPQPSTSPARTRAVSPVLESMVAPAVPPVLGPPIDITASSDRSPQIQPLEAASYPMGDATNATSPSSSPLESLPLPPLINNITNRAAADMSAVPSLPQMFQPHTDASSFADFAFHHLGTDSSTEEMIAALRRVAVHLAAGIDQMERRRELRTMTENLRILDEVGSLRAIVNTMRMQVMNRPTSATPATGRVADSNGAEDYRTLDYAQDARTLDYAQDARTLDYAEDARTLDDAELPTPEQATRPFAPHAHASVRGLHRSMILAHRSMQPDHREVPERTSLDVEEWRQGVRESVAFSRMDTHGSDIYGDRAESVTSSRVTVGNDRLRGRPMAIPPPARNTEPSSLGRPYNRINPLHLLTRRVRHPSTSHRPS